MCEDAAELVGSGGVVAAPLYQAKADFFRTLGHPARIRVLELLAERDHAVHELLERIEIEPSNLSQQLAVLRRAGLVSQHRAGSVQLRHVDAGSCNGCEIEIAAAFGPVYDAERYGARLVASARHADALLVTGVVTQNMAEPLRRTLEATPTPRL